MREFDTQITEWLIGFRKQPLHLLADFIRTVIVLLFQHSTANFRKMVLCVRIVAIHRLARPESIFIELKQLFGGACVFSAAEDHGSETAIADRQSVYPLRGRLVIPEH